MRTVSRIISLAPTQTEIVAALDRLGNLIGVTENCDFPDGVERIPRFGSWYAPDLRRVIAAAPDLVCTFGSHHEEVRDTLLEAGIRVVHGDPGSVRESLEAILELAEILECPDVGATLLEGLQKRLERVDRFVHDTAPALRPTVFRVMHWKPLITVGSGSFQHDAVERAGGRNLMGDGPAPYYVCDPTAVRSRNPEVVFFCEPFIKPLLEEDPLWREVRAVRNGRIHVYDCGLTCRSGPRIVDMVERLCEALYPDCAL